jgi:dTDP-D-glucose 4,6-dehydratase
MIQVLKSEVLQRVKEDEMLQAKIATATDRKISTVKRWIEDNHIMLTTSTVLDCIREHEGLAEDIEMTELKDETIAA